MELWIRTQNKEKLIKAYCIELNQESNLFWLSNNDGKIYTTIGTYATKERALEVLDEIQNLLQPKIIYTQKEPIETFELGVYQLKQDVDMKIQEINRIIYEMPQD